MVEAVQEAPKRASFVGSVISGITGFVKGAFSGGIMGAIGGAVLAAVAAAVAFYVAPGAVGQIAEFIGAKSVTTMVTKMVEVAGGEILPEAVPVISYPIMGFLGAASTMGAAVGGAVLSVIGAGAGTVTGVVKSREAGQATTEDLANVANILAVQNVALAQKIDNQHAASKHHASSIETQRAAMAMAERQIIN